MAAARSATASVALLIGVATPILFVVGALRHFVVRSTAYDLAIFDQATYLISIGAPPISSIMGMHILGDHAAPIWYPLALSYVVYPSVYLLLFIQALGLALGAWPTYLLARDAGLSPDQARLMATVYLLYPTVFKICGFDFHPEVLAVPALLATVYAARRQHFGWFCAGVVVILSCKGILALTVFGMGLWLLTCERRPLYGVVAGVAGLVWFGIATLLIVPYYTGADAAQVMGDSRYAELGATLPEIVHTVVTRPHVLFAQVWSRHTLVYLLLLASPVAWGLAPRHLAPLLAVAPQVMLNVLSTVAAQRSLAFQYQLPIVPFLMLAVLSAAAAGDLWIQDRRRILAWSVVAFILCSQPGNFVRYAATLETWAATRAALARLPPDAAVFTDNCIAPQISQRAHLYIPLREWSTGRIPDVDYALFNTRHPCDIAPGTLAHVVNTLRHSASFQIVSEENGVVLFQRSATAAASFE